MNDVLHILFFLSLLCSLIQAKSDESSNLTVTFSADSSGDCTDHAAGITFSTASIPTVSECFNLDDIFASDSNGTSVTSKSGTRPDDIYKADWVVHNKNAYDPQTNYSTVWYQQTTNITDKVGAGQDAARQFNVYSGRDCKQGQTPDQTTLEPWIGYSCQSESGGQCNTASISIKSFRLDDARRMNKENPKCWDFAYMGSAARTTGAGDGAIVAGVLVAVFSMF